MQKSSVCQHSRMNGSVVSQWTHELLVPESLQMIVFQPCSWGRGGGHYSLRGGGDTVHYDMISGVIWFVVSNLISLSGLLYSFLVIQISGFLMLSNLYVTSDITVTKMKALQQNLLQISHYKIMALMHLASLVPRPQPAFRHLQYGKMGRAWYLFSHEHDAWAWCNRKFSKQTGCISRIVQLTTHSTLGAYDNHSPLARYVR